MASDDEMMMNDNSSCSILSTTTEYSTISSSSSSSSNDSPKPFITTTISNKRNLMLVIEGYHFQLKIFSKDGNLKIWRCENRNCRVLLHTNLKNEFVRYGGKSSVHSHLPNPSASEIRNLREAMRKRAQDETTPLQQIAEQEVRQALLTAEALAVLPGIFHLGHNLTHQRRKLTPPLPQSSSFSIPEFYTKDYHDKDRLLLHDSDDPTFLLKLSGDIRSGGRVLVWSTDTQLKLLFDSPKLHMDGTFSTVPSQFKQVFIIQAFLHGSCLPVLYALLPDKKTPTYIHLFNVLFDVAERLKKKFNPKIIMTDFEAGLVKAITIEFSENTLQKGCFFHFTKGIYRHVQSSGLTSAYLNNMMVRTVVRRMMALALVPPQFILELFADLGNFLSEDERDDINPMFTYFTDYWLPRISMWNVFDISDRTNNYSEGYNNRFSNRLDKSHPNIWYFIEAIQKEVDTVHSLITQINSGMCPRTKRLQTKLAQNRIDELYKRFNKNAITAQELLEELSFFVPND